MHVLTIPGVNDAWAEGLELIREHSRPESSRYGDVLRVPEPVTTVYARPLQRVLSDPVRDANPFFHLMEALWILDGRRDVHFLAMFNARMKEFSDDGTNFHAAYGYRLRHHFGFDQLEGALDMLRMTPDSRRAVMSIWDPKADLGVASKDIPCNDTIKVEINDGALDMIVFNRSNDMIWGAYGANAVQFSVLLEYMAAMLNVPVGTYTQISSNFHVYREAWKKFADHIPEAHIYQRKIVTRVGLVSDAPSFQWELHDFFRQASNYEAKDDAGAFGDYINNFFPYVAIPMYLAHRLWKKGLRSAAMDMLDMVIADDWREVTKEWLGRRVDK